MVYDSSLLKKATLPDVNPAPGYLFNEIAKMSHEDFATSQKIQKYLLDRVGHKNINTKYKALVVIKHVCRKGRPDIRREMMRDCQSIKECLQYKGAPDPLHGDAPSKKVRDAAKECMDAIYSDGDTATQNSGMASRIQGMGGGGPPPGAGGGGGGGGGYQGGGGGGGGTGSGWGGTNNKYGGMGNPNFEDHRNVKKSAWDKAKEAAGDIASTAASKYAEKSRKGSGSMGGKTGGYGSGGNYGVSNVGDHAYQGRGGAYNPGEFSGGGGGSSYGGGGSGGSYGGGYGGGGGSGYQSSQSSYSSDSSAPRSRGRPGGGWGDAPVQRAPAPAPSNYNRPSSGSTGSGSYGGNDNSSQPSQQETNGEWGSTGKGTGDFEASLVEDLCSEGGMRAEPPREKIEAFVKAASTLDVNTVCVLLEERLQSSSWQVQTKALVAIEKVCAASHLDSYLMWWQENPAEVENLQNAQRAAVRDRATRVLGTLGFQVEENVPKPATRQPRGRYRPQAAAPSPAPAIHQTTDLLGGFDDPAPQNTGYAQPPPAPQQSQAPPQQQQQAPPADLFGGMMVGGMGAAAPVQAPAPAPAPAPIQQQAPPVDLFGSLSLADQLTTDTQQVQGRTERAKSVEALDPLNLMSAPPLAQQQQQPQGMGGMGGQMMGGAMPQQQPMMGGMPVQMGGMPMQQPMGGMPMQGGGGMNPMQMQQQQQMQMMQMMQMQQMQQRQQMMGGGGMGMPQQQMGMGGMNMMGMQQQGRPQQQQMMQGGGQLAYGAGMMALGGKTINLDSAPAPAAEAQGFGFMQADDSFGFVKDQMNASKK